MKQGKSYFTVILWILLAAIAAYFGYHVISSLYAPLMTATVTPYEAGAGYYASGFVVREEELLYSQYGTTVLSCAEGAHVAANDVVATGYRSDDAKTRKTRMDELTGQIYPINNVFISIINNAMVDKDGGEYEVTKPFFNSYRGILWKNNVCKLRAHFRTDDKNIKVLENLKGVDITPEVPEE